VSILFALLFGKSADESTIASDEILAGDVEGAVDEEILLLNAEHDIDFVANDGTVEAKQFE